VDLLDLESLVGLKKVGIPRYHIILEAVGGRRTISSSRADISPSSSYPPSPSSHSPSVFIHASARGDLRGGSRPPRLSIPNSVLLKPTTSLDLGG